MVFKVRYKQIKVALNRDTTTKIAFISISRNS